MERPMSKVIRIALVFTVWTWAAACGGGGDSSNDASASAGQGSGGGGAAAGTGGGASSNTGGRSSDASASAADTSAPNDGASTGSKPGPGPSGSGAGSSSGDALGCWDTLECMIECDEDPDESSCDAGCMAGADKEAFELIDILGNKCEKGTLCRDYAIAACFTDVGGVSAQATSACAGYLACVAQCPSESTYACKTDCGWNVDEDQVEAADALVDCLTYSDCKDPTCFVSVCKNLFEACVGR